MKKIGILGVIFAIIISGCSAAQKARREERDRVVQSKGVLCDFVSESDFKDIDIELNLRIAKRCDASKPFNISSYKRVSENPGVLYCCNTNGNVSFDNETSKSDSAQDADAPVKAAPAKTPTTK
jgi:hypothetical protein